jgi:hypothetical protein
VVAEEAGTVEVDEVEVDEVEVGAVEVGAVVVGAVVVGAVVDAAVLPLVAADEVAGDAGAGFAGAAVAALEPSPTRAAAATVAVRAVRRAASVRERRDVRMGLQGVRPVGGRSAGGRRDDLKQIL